jgi:hypothetical protein
MELVLPLCDDISWKEGARIDKQLGATFWQQECHYPSPLPPPPPQPSCTSRSHKQKQETLKQKLEISSRSPESGGNSTKKPRANVNSPIMAWQEEPLQLPMGSSSDGGYSCCTQRLLVILWGPVHPNRYGRKLSTPNMTAALVVRWCHVWKTLLTFMATYSNGFICRPEHAKHSICNGGTKSLMDLKLLVGKNMQCKCVSFTV